MSHCVINCAPLLNLLPVLPDGDLRLAHGARSTGIGDAHGELRLLQSRSEVVINLLLIEFQIDFDDDLVGRVVYGCQIFCIHVQIIDETVE